MAWACAGERPVCVGAPKRDVDSHSLGSVGGAHSIKKASRLRAVQWCLAWLTMCYSGLFVGAFWALKLSLFTVWESVVAVVGWVRVPQV